jgi:hypothetical protein
MSRYRVALGAVAILVAIVGHARVVGQTVTDQEPRIGTWKLNLEKSQFATGILVGSLGRCGSDGQVGTERAQAVVRGVGTARRAPGVTALPAERSEGLWTRTARVGTR